MGKYLMIDIGAGTMDLLYSDTTKNVFYKAVLSSPIKKICEEINNTEGNILLTGCEMGGGKLSNILKEKVKKNLIIITKKAANTISHNICKIKKLGLKIIEEEEIAEYKKKYLFYEFNFSDLQIDFIKNLTKQMGVPFYFDTIAVCAQDHGFSLERISQIDLRYNKMKKTIKSDCSLSSFLYSRNNIPKEMNRLNSILKILEKLPSKNNYVMDSGISAILGAYNDANAIYKKNIIILDIATSHTIGAAMENGFLTSFFEYHTSHISLKKLKILIKKLPEGKISHEKIIKDGGHGAYSIKSFSRKLIEAIIVTGPMRFLINDINNFYAPVFFGSPLGDNMMTGIAGLIEALKRKYGLFFNRKLL